MDATGPKTSESDTVADDAMEARSYDRYRAMRDDPNREARWAKWREDNAGAIQAYNDWFEAEGHKYLTAPRF